MRMTGSPASMTPSEPGRTQSGRPMTSVAAHAVMPTPAVAAAQRPTALPTGRRWPARIAGAAGAAPLVVTVSSTRTRSRACWGRSFGSFARQAMTSSASGPGVSARSVRGSRGVSLMCAASSRAGVAA